MPEETTNPTLEQAVASAVEQTPAAETTTPETPQTGETAEATTAETTPAEKPSGQELSPELQQAQQIYQLLTNPATREGALQYLAGQAGFKLDKPPVAQPPALTEVIAKELGDYAFMAPQLTNALQAVLAPVQQELMQYKVAASVDKAIATMNAKTEGDFSKREADISKLMDVLKPADGVSYEQYFEQLYTLASGKSPSSSATKILQKIQTNAREALPSPSAVQETRVVQGPKLPTISEAVAAALRGEKFQD